MTTHKKKFIPDDTQDHYWICMSCAKKRGWVPVPWPFTSTITECPYCGIKANLGCASTDFIKNGKKPLIWD